MEEMFIGTNSKGLVVGDASVLKFAVPQDQESRDMIVSQIVDAATSTPYTEPVEETTSDMVQISDVVAEAELCM